MEPSPTDHAVNYYLHSNQLWGALIALVIGMPATWKTFGLIGKFFSRRFDNRDELVKLLISGQSEEHKIRMAEAKAQLALADAHKETANAILELARSFKDAVKGEE